MHYHLLLIEHKAVLDTCEALEEKNLAEIVYLQVDRQGHLDLEHLEKIAPKDYPCFVMAANKEIGTINFVRSIAIITANN